MALSTDSAVEEWRNTFSWIGEVPGKLISTNQGFSSDIGVLPWPMTDEWNINKRGREKRKIWWKSCQKPYSSCSFLPQRDLSRWHLPFWSPQSTMETVLVSHIYTCNKWHYHYSFGLQWLPNIMLFSPGTSRQFLPGMGNR